MKKQKLWAGKQKGLLLDANALRGSVSFACFPSKTVWWICAKMRNKSRLFLPYTIQRVAFEVTCAPQGTDRNRTQTLLKSYWIWCEMRLTFGHVQKVIFSSLWATLSFSILPWCLNPSFPLVIPSGPGDSLRDLAQSPGSDSGSAWVDLLQLLACRD